MSTLAIAPWVIVSEQRDGLLLFGPQHEVIRIPKECALDPSEPGVAHLVKRGFLIEVPSPHHRESAPVPRSPREGAAGSSRRAFGAGYVVSRDFPTEAAQLTRALAQIGGPRRWRIAGTIEEAADAASRARGRRSAAAADRPGRPRLLVVSASEPCRLEAHVAPLLPHFDVIWFGECAEGTHAGPVFRALADVARYVEATHGWTVARRLSSLGFGEMWPLPLPLRIREDAGRVARAVASLERGGADRCVLLQSERRVTLWTRLRSAPCRPAALRPTQTWSKGLLKSVTFRALPGLPQAVVGACLTPAGGIDDLESNSGKGLSEAEADTCMVGEAIERFAAWEANRSVSFVRVDPRLAARGSQAPAAHGSAPPLAARSADREPSSYRLEAFHPYGALWEQHLKRGSPPLPEVDVLDLTSSRRVRVPACLVPFPYVPPPGEQRPASLDTAGLASYVSFEGAVLRGAREILERSDLYPSFLHGQIGRRLSTDVLRALPDAPDVMGLVRHLEREGRLWLVCYGTSIVPIVHAFYLDREIGVMARGSGSALDVATAARKAIIEAVQIRLQHGMKAPALVAGAYANWAKPAVIRAIVEYLEAQPAGAFEQRPDADDAAQLERILAWARAKGVRLLLARLPCPVRGFFAVRVLAPGLTTNQHPSESAGGRRLRGATFVHGVPS